LIENTNKYYNSLADNVKNIETNMKTLTDNDVPVIDENLTEAQEILNKQNITNAKISNPESAPIHNNDEENKKMMERITDFIKNFLAKITALFSKS
jgi:Skp family chaperone for outer membrane proteins